MTSEVRRRKPRVPAVNSGGADYSRLEDDDDEDKYKEATKKNEHQSWAGRFFCRRKKTKANYHDLDQYQRQQHQTAIHHNELRVLCFNCGPNSPDIEEVSQHAFFLCAVIDLLFLYISFREYSINPVFGVEVWVILTATYLCLVFVCFVVIHGLAHVFRAQSPGHRYVYRDEFYYTLTVNYIMIFIMTAIRMGSLWVFHERYYGEDPYTISERTNVDNREKRMHWEVTFAVTLCFVLKHIDMYLRFMFLTKKRQSIKTDKIDREIRALLYHQKKPHSSN